MDKHIIENGIVPIFDSESGLTVDARTLHNGLHVGRDFSNWIKGKIEIYGFIEGEDYSPILADRSDGLPGKPRIEYALSLDCGKEIAMTENTEQGHKVRRYFIEAEKRYRKKPVTMVDFVEYTARALREQEERVKALESSNQQIAGTVSAIRSAVEFHPDNWRESINKMLNRIGKSADNSDAYRKIRTALYKELERRAGCSLDRRLDNYRSRLLKEGATKTAINKACPLDIIDQDPRLREIFLEVVKEAIIRYGCEVPK